MATQRVVTNVSKIKHIVLCGGAYLGLYQIGSLMELNQRGFYSIDNIHSIHGTSIGALTGILLCLKSEWSDIVDYFEKRPWQKFIKLNPNMLFEIIPNKGLLSFKFIQNILKPFFHSKNVPLEITLAEFYELSGIELFIYAISLNEFECVEFSHKSHPDLQLLHALYMSCSLPYIFQPMYYDGSYYIDGGLLNNHPVRNCLEYAKEDEILSIKFGSKPVKEGVKEDANIFEFGYYIYRKLVRKARQKPEYDIPYEIVIPCMEVNMGDVNMVLTDEDVRHNYIEHGVEVACEFLDRLNESIDFSSLDISYNHTT